MRKYLLLHALIISFVFFLTPTIQAASDVEEAIEEYKQAIRINPDDATAHINLGVAYVESGMYKEAIEACKQAIRIDPDYADAYVILGAAYVLLNDIDSALEQYKILENLDSEMADELFNIMYEALRGI